MKTLVDMLTVKKNYVKAGMNQIIKTTNINLMEKNNIINTMKAKAKAKTRIITKDITINEITVQILKPSFVPIFKKECVKMVIIVLMPTEKKIYDTTRIIKIIKSKIEEILLKIILNL